MRPKKKSGFHQRLEYQEQMINNKVTEQCNTTNNNGCNDSCNYKLDNDNNISSNKKKLSIGRKKVIWFNTGFCKLSNIDIGKYFLKLIDRHFNKENPLNKTFIKISYSCINNILK